MKKGKALIMKGLRTYWVRYIASNGRILADSEQFNTKRAAKGNIASMRKFFSGELLIEEQIYTSKIQK